MLAEPLHAHRVSLPALQPLSLAWLDQAKVEVAVLRLDLIDPLISGNKWYKLAPYLAQAREHHAEGLISLGGPHSNHLHALAAAGCRAGLPTVGLLRGEPQDTPTTRDLAAFGMQVHWLGYAGYRARHAEGFWGPWKSRYPGFLPVPEGGGGLPGALGCATLVEPVHALLADVGWDDFDGWWLAAGTGATLAGLAIGEWGRHCVHGALAGPPAHGVADEVAHLLAAAGLSDAPVSLIPASRRGFGRLDDELRTFMRATERDCGIPLDPVYTAKALMALKEAAERSGFSPGSRLIFVHTGGLQGRRAAFGESLLAG